MTNPLTTPCPGDPGACRPPPGAPILDPMGAEAFDYENRVWGQEAGGAGELYSVASCLGFRAR